MLVEVVVAVKHVALGPERRITSSAPGLLHIVLERIGDVVVNDEAYVRFAAVYRKFTDVGTFMNELKKLVDEKI